MDASLMQESGNLGPFRVRDKARVRGRYFMVTGGHKGCCVYQSVADGGGRGVASGLQLEGRPCSMLTVMRSRFGVRVRAGAKVRIGLRFAFILCLGLK